MKCNKTKERDIFNLFKVYDCEDCKYTKKDEYIYIGRRIIGIYKFIKCEFNQRLLQDKFVVFLLEAIKNKDDIILLWGGEYMSAQHYEALDSFLESGLDIQIINC